VCAPPSVVCVCVMNGMWRTRVAGTCVNVGCIPKKLMHNGECSVRLRRCLRTRTLVRDQPTWLCACARSVTAALLKESMKDARQFGWQGCDAPVHDWATLRQNVRASRHRAS
jgi:pyruvate/2-oxoglutarate dehydrogenase complex dihydrolipoamide dehydrogenase (E3) component